MNDLRISDFSEAVAQDERFLAEQLFDYFHPKERTDDDNRGHWSCAFESLFSAHLRLDPFWPNADRWIEGISVLAEWKPAAATLRLAAVVDWGFTINYCFGRYAPLDAEFRLLQAETAPTVDYVIRFCCDGIARRVTPSGIEWDLVDSDSRLGPDVNLFRTIFLRQFADHADPVFLADSGEVPVEIKAIFHPGEYQRFVVAVCLGQCGNDGKALLIECLHHPSAEVRYTVLQTLVRFRRSPTFDVLDLTPFLQDDDKHVRCLTASILVWAQHQDPASPTLIGSVKDFLDIMEESHNRRCRDRVLRWGAFKIVTTQTKANPSLLSLVFNAADMENHYDFASNVLAALGAAASETIPILTDKFLAGDRGAGRMLWRIGTDKARDVLIDALRNPESGAFLHSLYILAGCEPDESAVPILKRLLNDGRPSNALRREVVAALARVEPRSDDVRIILRRTAKRLIEEFPEAETDEQWDILQLLERIGPQAVEAVPLLVSVVKDAFIPEERLVDPTKVLEWWEKERFPIQAIEILGNLGEKASLAVPTLVGSLESETHNSRRRTCTLEALGKMGNPGIEAIIEVLSRKPDQISEWYDFREPLKEAGPMVVPKLLEAFDKPAVCSCALKILPSFGPQAAEAAPVIRELLAHPDPSVRVEAAVCLSKIGPEIPETINDLTKLLDDSDAEVRCAALSALQRFGPSAELVAAVKRFAKLEDSVARKVLDRSIKARRN